MEKSLYEKIGLFSRIRALHPYGMCEVLPQLYLGSVFDARDSEQMDANQISDIICIHGIARTRYINKAYNVMYININDSPGENISFYFYDAVEFIHKARLQKRSVLVHCLAGVSRSAVIIAAYLVAVTSLDYSLALTYLKKRRPCTDPNFGFRMQLYRFASESLLSTRRRLAECFGSGVMECQRKLDYTALLILCDTVTKAQLDRKEEVIDGSAMAKTSNEAVWSLTASGDSVDSFSSCIADFCYIDD